MKKILAVLMISSLAACASAPRGPIPAGIGGVWNWEDHQAVGGHSGSATSGGMGHGTSGGRGTSGNGAGAASGGMGRR